MSDPSTIDNANIDTNLEALFTFWSRASGVIVAIIGCIIMAARIFQIQALEFATGGAGAGFFFTGCALFLLPQKDSRLYYTGYGLALLGTLLALLNVGRFFFGIELVSMISNLQIGDFEAARLIAMSPSDSIEILLNGIALLLISVQIGKIRPSELLAFSAALLSVMTLLGVILKIDTFCVFIACARITEVGGLTFALLSLGTVFARSNQGLMSLMCSRDAGGIVARRMIPTALCIPIFISWLGMLLKHQLGLSDELGLTFVIGATVILFSFLLWWNCWSLDKADAARRRAVVDLTQSEIKTRLIIQQAIDAFIAIDDNGLIKDWNERAEYTFGWSRNEVLGRSVYGTIFPTRCEEQTSEQFKSALDKAQDGNASKPSEAIFMHKDEHEFPGEISLFAVTIVSERLLCGFVRDITERKEAEQRFKEFYSTVGHELRSPLTSIRGSVILIRTLTGERLPDNCKNLLDIAENALERLIRLINDLMDVKRIEEGQLSLEWQPLEPLKMARLANEGLAGMANANHVQLATLAEDNLTISGDADRIVQVLTNLIANAIKFSPKNGLVTVKMARSKNLQRLRFSVQDQGPGIAPSDLQKLFNKFGQLADSRRKLGTGLGLAISKAIVEQHGGEIGIESVVGEGSNFWFEIPLSQQGPVMEEQMTTIKMKKSVLLSLLDISGLNKKQATLQAAPGAPQPMPLTETKSSGEHSLEPLEKSEETDTLNEVRTAKT